MSLSCVEFDTGDFVKQLDSMLLAFDKLPRIPVDDSIAGFLTANIVMEHGEHSGSILFSLNKESYKSLLRRVKPLDATLQFIGLELSDFAKASIVTVKAHTSLDDYLKWCNIVAILLKHVKGSEIVTAQFIETQFDFLRGVPSSEAITMLYDMEYCQHIKLIDIAALVYNSNFTQVSTKGQLPICKKYCK